MKSYTLYVCRSHEFARSLNQKSIIPKITIMTWQYVKFFYLVDESYDVNLPSKKKYII